ncbi:YcxB family protein, partial [Clostridium perfringens]
NVTYCWDKVEEVKDIGTHIFIYISNLNAIVIPSNSFRDEREKNELIKIINENIKNLTIVNSIESMI